MKALNPFSESVLLLLLVLVMMVMMVQTSDLFGVTNADAHPKFRPVERNGKLYYIHKDNFLDFKLAQKKCAADGGILAEINDWNEFDFIEDYLAKARSQGVSLITYIGATYSYDARRWNLPSTGQPLPVTHFRYEYDYRRRFFCIVLKQTHHMWQEECHLPFGSPLEGIPTVRYLCEKIYAPYHPKQLPNADTNIPAIEFRDKIYYIHKKQFTDYQANLEDCKADGGMMAEINDGLEFQVVHKYVSSTFTSGDHVFIGGKKTGNSWVLPSTNQPLPYVKWGHHEPYVYPLPIFNCLILFKDKGWNMASMWCDSNVPSEYRFLCEMPLL